MYCDQRSQYIKVRNLFSEIRYIYTLASDLICWLTMIVLFYLQALHVEEYQAQQEQKLVRELEAMVRIKNLLF